MIEWARSFLLRYFLLRLAYRLIQQREWRLAGSMVLSFLTAPTERIAEVFEEFVVREELARAFARGELFEVVDTQE